MQKNRFFIYLGIVLLIALIGIAINNKTTLGSFLGVKKASDSIDAPTIDIDYSNLPQALSSSSIVNELPADASIVLRFYNFNSGEREWEKSYIILKGKVKEGYNADADMIVSLHSKYIEPLTNKNFCSIVKGAQKNGDFGYESKLSDARMLWKYKAMIKYRECFGF
jgi:hypothetical protein